LTRQIEIVNIPRVQIELIGRITIVWSHLLHILAETVGGLTDASPEKLNKLRASQVAPLLNKLEKCCLNLEVEDERKMREIVEKIGIVKSKRNTLAHGWLAYRSEDFGDAVFLRFDNGAGATPVTQEWLREVHDEIWHLASRLTHFCERQGYLQAEPL